MCSTGSRFGSRMRSRASTESCTTSRTSPPRRSNGSDPSPAAETFLTSRRYRMTMRVYVVDNGGQWTHREWRVLKYLGVDAKIVPNDSPVSDLKDIDGLVLSGGAPRVGIDPEKMGKNGEYIDAFPGPILGVCAGPTFRTPHI